VLCGISILRAVGFGFLHYVIWIFIAFPCLRVAYTRHVKYVTCLRSPTQSEHCVALQANASRSTPYHAWAWWIKCPVNYGCWKHWRPLKKATSNLLLPWWKTLWVDWPRLEQSAVAEKSRPTQSEPLWSSWSSYHAPHMRLAQRISAIYRRGGRSWCSRCVGLVSSMDYDCPRTAQTILAIRQTRDCSGRPLSICWRKRLESTRPISSSRSSLKTTFDIPGIAPEHHSYSIATPLINGWKTIGQTDQNLATYNRVIVSMKNNARVNCSMDLESPRLAQRIPDRIIRGGSIPEVVIPMGVVFCRWIATVRDVTRVYITCFLSHVNKSDVTSIRKTPNVHEVCMCGGVESVGMEYGKQGKMGPSPHPTEPHLLLPIPPSLPSISILPHPHAFLIPFPHPFNPLPFSQPYPHYPSIPFSFPLSSNPTRPSSPLSQNASR